MESYRLDKSKEKSKNSIKSKIKRGLSGIALTTTVLGASVGAAKMIHESERMNWQGHELLVESDKPSVVLEHDKRSEMTGGYGKFGVTKVGFYLLIEQEADDTGADKENDWVKVSEESYNTIQDGDLVEIQRKNENWSDRVNSGDEYDFKELEINGQN